MYADPADSAHAQFISEPITPTPGTFDAGDMGRALPGLPGEFTWRDRTYRVVAVLGKWKESGPEVGRWAGERYLRRHYFRVRTTSGEEMVLYCERNARSPERPEARWWLYSVQHPE